MEHPRVALSSTWLRKAASADACLRGASEWELSIKNVVDVMLLVTAGGVLQLLQSVQLVKLIKVNLHLREELPTRHQSPRGAQEATEFASLIGCAAPATSMAVFGAPFFFFKGKGAF